MSIVHANNKTTISLGRQGENLARQVVFDLSDRIAGYGDGTAELIYQRPGDETPYPVVAVRDGNTLVWSVSNLDTAVAASYGSYGRCELRWYVGEVLAKSQTWRTWVEPAMGTPAETAPPAPEQGWVEQVLATGAAAQQAAAAAKADADRAATLASDVAAKAAQTAQDATVSMQAKEAAQTAQGLAETAKRAAETAKQAAEAAQAAVAQSASDAEAAKQGAESALLNAQAAASAAAQALSDIRELYQQMQTWAEGVVKAVSEAGSDAVHSVQIAGDAQVQRVSEEGAQQTANAKDQADAAALSATDAAQSAKEAAESAAVYDDVVGDVTQLKSDLEQLDAICSELYIYGDYVDAEPVLTNNQFYYFISQLKDDGAVDTHNDYMTARVGVENGVKYRISAQVAGSSSFGAYFLEFDDGSLIGYHRNTSGTEQTITDMDVDTADAVALIVTSKKSVMNPVIKKSTSEFIKDVALDNKRVIEDAHISEIPVFTYDADTFTPVDLSGGVSIIEGEKWLSRGETKILENWYRTNKIEVVPGATYLLRNYPRYAYVYDSTGGNGTMVTLSGNDFEKYTVPSGKMFIGFYAQKPAKYNMQMFRITPVDDEIHGIHKHAELLSITFNNLARENVRKTISPMVGKRIVNFGDSIIGNFYAPQDVSSYLSEYSGAVTFNCGFGGNTLATHYNADYAHFSFHRLVDAIVARDFTEQRNALGEYKTSPLRDVWTNYTNRLNTLESIDFDTIDAITIAYGTNDWAFNEIIDGENKTDVTNFLGAFRYSVEKLLTAYPHIKVFVCTPIFRTKLDSSNNPIMYSDTWEQEGGEHKKLTDFVDALKNVSNEYGFTCIDNYYDLGINKLNRLIYFPVDDGTHPNEKGRELIGSHIAKCLW